MTTYWKQFGYDIEVIHPDVDMTPAAKQDPDEAPITKNRKMFKNKLIQRKVPEEEARLIAAMMEAAGRKPRRIRCVSMHSRLNERFGKKHGDHLYDQLENYFIKNLQPS